MNLLVLESATSFAWLKCCVTLKLAVYYFSSKPFPWGCDFPVPSPGAALWLFFPSESGLQEPGVGSQRSTGRIRQSRHDTEQTYMGVFIYDLGKQDRPWHPIAAQQMAGIRGLGIAARWPVFREEISAGTKE